MQDQLIIFMALASGRSSMLCGELTLHTRTSISIAGQLLPEVKFDISTVSTLPTAAETAGSKASATAPQLLYLVQCTGSGTVSKGGFDSQLQG
jgi:RNA 3'-terminal phosphate cyclase (ATP)